MIKTLMRHTNIFGQNNFWRSNGSRSYSSVCGGLVSLPLLAIIIILLILKLYQMVTYGIVMSNTQITYMAEPILTTLSTSLTDPGYAPFMLAFTVNIDSTLCPNSAITFEAFVNQYTGAYTNPNRSVSKVPLNFESCSADHFGMLPGKLNKINQWTKNTLHCLPANSYFQIGGSNITSDLYKNIQFRFACPSSCAAATCGYVQFLTASSTVNLGNASSPYSYSLDRTRFQVKAVPSFQNSYQIDSSNMTSDNSIFPFSLNQLTVGGALGKVVTDIPVNNGDTNTYVTVQRSDKSTIFLRSYYKLFDLLAYMGGVIYGILILLFFIRNFSKIEFELNFAAEYFRIADSKAITFRGYLKQLFYEIIKGTRWKPDWRMAEEREQSRQAANKVLDVVYLNKRIAFLQEAISLIFDKHQLKGLHLLHTLRKDEVKGKITAHKFRDRLVYFLGKKYRHRDNALIYNDVKYQQNQLLPKSSSDGSKPNNLQELPESLDSGSDNPKELKPMKPKESYLEKENRGEVSMRQQVISGEKSNNQPQQVKHKKLTLKNLISHQMVDEQSRLNVQSDTNLIINEAESYYSELAENEKMKKIIVNSKDDNNRLKNQLNFIGELNSEELNQHELIEELSTDMRRLVEEGERMEGNQLSKKIYEKLDQWLKNYLRDTVKLNHI